MDRIPTAGEAIEAAIEGATRLGRGFLRAIDVLTDIVTPPVRRGIETLVDLAFDPPDIVTDLADIVIEILLAN